jgi:uridine kinase
MSVQIEREQGNFENLTEKLLLEKLSSYLKKANGDKLSVIVIVGGPASGKTQFAAKLAQTLGNSTTLGTDDYLKGDRHWRRANVEDVGRDPQEKYDRDFLNEQIQALINLKPESSLGLPTYDGETGIAISKDPHYIPDTETYKRKANGKQDYVIIEGDFQFVDEDIVDHLIYFDAEDEVRLQNRIHRDQNKRPEHENPEENIAKIRQNFESRQQTQFIPHTLPEKEKASILIEVKTTALPEPTNDRVFDYKYNLKFRQDRQDTSALSY